MPIKKTYNPWLIAIVTSLAAFMEVLDTTITNVSLSHIAGTLGASQDESTWVLTSYLIANGIVLPLSGWLSGVFGRKKFFMLCIAGFTLASFACGVSNSLSMLILFRLVQGLAGGGLQPMQQAIVIDAFPPEKRGMAFGLTGITMVVAPILGPTLGGYITDNFSWQWIFLMNVPVGIIALLLVAKMVEDNEHSKAKTGIISVDYIGLGLIAIGLGTLQIVLDKGQQEDWFSSNFIMSFAIISFVCLSFAIFWLLKQNNPLVDLRLMKQRSFGLSCMMMFFVGFSLYGGSVLLPTLTQSEYGYDATLAGFVLSPGGLFVILLMPISGKIVNIVPSRYLVALGMALTATGMFLTSKFSPQTDLYTFIFMRNIQVIGLPFLFIPISSLAFMNIPKDKSSNASAIFAMSRNLGGSVGISIMSSYVSRHQQIRQSILSANLNDVNIGYKNLLSSYINNAAVHGENIISATKTAMGRIYTDLLHQSSILAFSDAFYVNSIMMATLVFVAFLMPLNTPHNKKSDEPMAIH